MQSKTIKDILNKLKKKHCTVSEAFEQLKDLPFKDLGFAKIDYHREIRKHMPESIFCMGKTPKQVVDIFEKMKTKTNILATKATPEIMKAVSKKNPEAEIFPDCGIIFLGKYPSRLIGKVVILTGGTSDIRIAKEAEIVLKVMGVRPEPIYDVGVAGIHRLINAKEKIKDADIIIAVAGMDGVLPTVVAGLFAAPVIAVPTSIGYGSNFSGLAPLLTMLNSCAP
ncbi:MAG: hypothetical protein ACD_79C00694G0001, partial [uncultured bacterium]